MISICAEYFFEWFHNTTISIIILNLISGDQYSSYLD